MHKPSAARRTMNSEEESSMAKNLISTQCVYCVNANAETWDHVPPKGIFAADNRDDLIRVPACFNCNNSFSKDDEWLIQLVATNAEFQKFPGIGDVTDRACARCIGLSITGCLVPSWRISLKLSCGLVVSISGMPLRFNSMDIVSKGLYLGS